MSWDVLVLRLPEGRARVEDLPEGPAELPLGPRADVLAALAAAVPDADLSDPAWGELEGPGWSIEMDIGDKEPVDAVMLHVRGGGDDVLPVVLRIAEALGARAWDTAGGMLTGPGDTSGWHAFQEFRDHLTGVRSGG
ncbi:hypothetical protein [Streptomyces sp. NPDC047046]|uniref:hypothetical protein n=1 Tax=Streptomyces sp. NPDC047046 TaxID=3155378 RepID=UPI0033E3CE2C